MARKDFRVLIVGGGVAGLALANILEQLGVDFLVLEAYSDIAPQVGASIGLWANGMRVLSQIGCADAFARDTALLDDVTLRLRGKPFFKGGGSAHHLIRRHGYSVVFNDRQRLLQVLFDRLQSKDKVMLQKRVCRVETTKDGVTVWTKDKESFTGHIAVGADGVHSFVRSEMWRIAAEASPGYFSDRLENVKIRYRGLFGISRPTSTLPPTTVSPNWNTGFSYAVFGGPGGRVYWFMFERLPEPVWGHQTPQYSKQDELELAEAHRADVITEEVTFGQLYDSRFWTGITPLAEHVFEKWHFGRIITIGDATAKQNPISGQGGNSAIESAAALANALVRRLDASEGPQDRKHPLTAADIEAAFREAHSVRHSRAELAVEIGRENQKLEALESAATEYLAPFVVALAGRDVQLERQSGLIVNAVRVEALPMPTHRNYVPYTDELPAAPLRGFRSSVAPRLLVAACFAGIIGICSQVIQLDKVGHAVPPVKTRYTGIERLDEFLLPMVSSFWPVVTSGASRPEWLIQCIYLLSMAAAPVLVWTVEGYRRGNSESLLGRLLTWPGVFLGVMQLVTIAATAPFYFLLTLLTSKHPFYHRTTGRIVGPSVARALLPSLTIAFVIPTVLMFIPFEDKSVWQDAVALWQLSPVLVGPLVEVVSRLIRRHDNQTPQQKKLGEKGEEEDEDPHGLRIYENRDVPYLLGAYAAVGWGTAVVHLCAAAYIACSPTLTFASVFGAPLPPFGTAWSDKPNVGPEEGIAILLKYDLIVLTLSLTVWCLFSVFELRRLGYVVTRQAVLAGLAALASLVTLGPGAMYAGTWYWRETVISGLSR